MVSELPDSLINLSEETLSVGRTLYHRCWGDRRGLLIFLGAIVFFGLSWRVGFFVNDNISIANTLANVAEGRLAIAETVYGRSPDEYLYPGMYEFNGAVYGRNYGQVFFALPFLILVWVVSELIGLQAVLVGIWAGSFFGLIWGIGIEFEQPRAGVIIGGASSAVLFLLSMVFGQPIEPMMRHLVALQLMTIIAAAFVGVLLYRIITLLYDQDLGLVAGAIAVLSTSIGYWATVPKRHVLIAALAVGVLYCLVLSRTDHSHSFGFRALAYVLTGLAIWVHPPDGSVLLVSLAGIDLFTKARDTTSTQVVILSATLATSLLPYFITNAFISGTPYLPPRFLGIAGDIGSDAGLAIAISGGSRAIGIVSTTAVAVFLAWLFVFFAGSIGGVLLYLFTSRVYDRDPRILAGLVVFAIITAHRGVISRRHAMVAALGVAAVTYCFVRRRGGERDQFHVRTLAYGLTGLSIWLHPPLGGFLLIVLVGVDLLTGGKQTTLKQAAILGAVFIISLLPFVLTQFYGAENTIIPPWLLSSVSGIGSGIGQTPAESGDPGSNGLLSIISVLLFDIGIDIINKVSGQLIEGLVMFFDQPARPYHTFIRGGYTEFGDYRSHLTILESIPIVGVLAGVLVLVVSKLHSVSSYSLGRVRPRRSADLFVAVYAVLVVLMYQPRLPIHAQINMRYLVPILPGLVYSMIRLPEVRSTIRSNLGDIMWYYAFSVFGIGFVFLAITIVLRPAAVTLIQMYAVSGLGLAALMAIWSTAIHSPFGRLEVKRNVGALLMSLSGAFGTILILLPGNQYWSIGIQVIPIF